MASPRNGCLGSPAPSPIAKASEDVAEIQAQTKAAKMVSQAEQQALAEQRKNHILAKLAGG